MREACTSAKCEKCIVYSVMILIVHLFKGEATYGSALVSGHAIEHRCEGFRTARAVVDVVTIVVARGSRRLSRF
jgi:hypothetical protein